MSNSQERLSEEVLGMVEYDLEEGHQISWGHAKFMFDEIKRLQDIEADYITLKEIIDRARNMAFLLAEEDEPGPRFKMDSNGNLERIN